MKRAQNTFWLTYSLFGLLFALPAAAANNPVGFNVHLQQRFSSSDWDAALQLMEDEDLKWAREEFNWNLIEPTDDDFNFTEYDAVLAAYNDHNVNVVGLLTYSADFAQRGNDEFSPPKKKAWKNYVRTVVSRYKDSVNHWEIWNEPNNSFWSGTNKQYADMLADAYDMIKDVDADATVIMGGLSGADTSFLQDICDQTQKFDAVAVHPYREKSGSFTYAPEDSTDGLNNLLTDMHNFSRQVDDCKPSAKIWVTEFGYPTKETGATGVGVKQQRIFLLRSITQMLTIPDVKRVLLYELRDSGTEATNQEHHFGVVDRDLEDKTGNSVSALGTWNRVLSKKTYIRTHRTPKALQKGSQAGNWRVTEASNSTASVQYKKSGTVVDIDYNFTSNENSYVILNAPLPANTSKRLLGFRVKAPTEPVLLRLRATDASGEVHQFTLGTAETTWTEKFVRLSSDYRTTWNGDGNGRFDYPLTGLDVVIDDDYNATGSGEVRIKDLQLLGNASYYGYVFQKGSRRFTVNWATKKRRLTYRSTKKGAHRFITVNGTTDKQRKKQFKYTARKLPKIIRAPR